MGDHRPTDLNKDVERRTMMYCLSAQQSKQRAWTRGRSDVLLTIEDGVDVQFHFTDH